MTASSVIGLAIIASGCETLHGELTWSGLDQSVSAATESNTGNTGSTTPTPTIVTTPSIVLNSPLTAQYAPSGTTVSVTWTSAGPNLGATPVTFKYSADAGATWINFPGSPTYTASGTAGWVVPAAADGTAYLVRGTLTDLSGGFIHTSSFASFTVDSIAPALSLTSFNAGGTFTGGMAQNLSWTVSDAHLGTLPMILQYSLDAGATWSLISASALASVPATFSWTLPMAETTTAKVRVIATDLAGNSTTVTSPANFTIRSTPGFTAISPAKGSANGGTTVTITGANLTSATSVSIGGNACTPVTFNSSTSISCITGAHIGGAFGVTLTNPLGLTLTQAAAYFYTADAVWVGNALVAGAVQPTVGWTATSVSTPLASSAGGAFNFANSVAVDRLHGHFYVTDYTNHRVQKFNLDTGAFEGWMGAIATNGGTCAGALHQFTGGWCIGGTSEAAPLGTAQQDGSLNSPSPIAVDPANNLLYVGDSASLLKYNLTTGAFLGRLGKIGANGGSCVAGAGAFTGMWCTGGTAAKGNGDGMFDGTAGLAIDVANSRLYAADFTNSRLEKFNLATGAFIGWAGRISTTGGTCVAGAGLFTGGWCTGGTSVAGSGNGMINSPYDLVLDTTNGNLYLADGSNHRISRYTAATGAFTGWLGAIGSIGGTCTANPGFFSGGWCTGGTAAMGTGDGMFNIAGAVRIDVAGNLLYAADGNGNRIEKFRLSDGVFAGWMGRVGTATTNCTTPVGQFTEKWCSGGTSQAGSGLGMFDAVYGFDIDPASSFMYVADFYNNRIQRVTPL